MIDLIKKLKTQLRLIESSCRIYDEEGFTEQALHIAVALRVIFHDTNKSTSLLKLLNKKDDIELNSTFVSPEKSCSILGAGDWHTVMPLMLTSRGREVPKNSWRTLSELSVNEWWEENIWIESGITLSRKDLVLLTCNKDGGAHIETKLPKKLQKMHKGPKILSVKINGVEQQNIFENHHHALIRQIAYEVLNSPQLTRILGN